MKKTACLVALFFAFSLILYPIGTTAQEASRLGPKYGGQIFKDPSDPQYRSYEQEIKSILLEQIKDEYGVVLDGGVLSPERLLEIEALLRLKRSKESIEYILNRFPGVLLPGTSS
jgi:hypothetical protein